VPRIVVLGCGTGVGKTRVSIALLRELEAAGQVCVGLKPIESGFGTHDAEAIGRSDATSLALASSARSFARPLYALRDPVSPHLAARSEGIEIDVGAAVQWVLAAEDAVTTYIASDRALWSLVESAGGVFSPLSGHATNYELALALEPAIWVLVAADTLGVLHDVSACIAAMRSRGRAPDHVVLSAAREPDLSTGTNAAELRALGIASPAAVLARNDDRGIEDLVHRLIDRV
jgi:dethiobiotin synthetase